MGNEKTIVLNEGQKAALEKIMSFLKDKDGPRVFILKGYAGTGKTFKQLMMDDILYQPQSNLSAKQLSRLYGDFIMRMKAQNISESSPAFEDFMRSDKYLNALRVSFGYSVTCHKVQGGEWESVYAYFPRNIMLNPTKEKYQWVYTAMTRAKEKFFVIDDIYIDRYRKY